MAKLTQREVDAIYALRHASEWVYQREHGDNCFVSDHYPGDPGNRCNCGKQSLLDAINIALDGYPEQADSDGVLLDLTANASPRVPLTVNQIDSVLDEAKVPEYPGNERIDVQIARAIERAHGIGTQAPSGPVEALHCWKCGARNLYRNAGVALPLEGRDAKA